MLALQSRALLDHLEQSKQAEWEVEEDYYWEAPADGRYNPHAEPGTLSLGQLSDNWGELKRITDGEAEPIGYALVWLAAILRRVGEKAVG
jgi:hypothetical protein